MTTIKDNIEELRKIINGTSISRVEALEFIDAIEGNIEELYDEIKEKENKICGLRDDIDDYEESRNKIDAEIDCGIGLIEYKEPDNILLQSIMENLGEAIQKYGAKRVNELIEVKQLA